MKSFNLLILLLLALLATSLAYMDPLDEGEDENDDRALDENDDTPGEIGDRCGSNNLCAHGLDCVRFPIRRKCFPVTCGMQALRQTIDQTGFDLQGYGKEMMDTAGVTMESDMFRAFPGPGLNLFNEESDDTLKMKQAIMESNPPGDLFAAAFNNCTGRATEAGATPYFGASWELGALGTYNGDLYWGQGTSDAVGLGLLNNCFGFVLGYDAGISGLLGLALTGRIADLNEGCKQMFPIADFPPFGLQIGFIASESPTFILEVTGGASASAGLPGYTTCTTTAL